MYGHGNIVWRAWLLPVARPMGRVKRPFQGHTINSFAGSDWSFSFCSPPTWTDRLFKPIAYICLLNWTHLPSNGVLSSPNSLPNNWRRKAAELPSQLHSNSLERKATEIHVVVAAFLWSAEPFIKSDISESLSGRFHSLEEGGLNENYKDWNTMLMT